MENNMWDFIFEILEDYGYFGFTEDPRYLSAKRKLLSNDAKNISKQEYTQLFGAIKSAESRAHKMGASQIAYALRRLLYHSREEGLHEFAELKDKYGGCFVATTVYGSYDAPQVRILRCFRDNYLEKKKLGRIFVYVYYKYSPNLAKKLESKELWIIL